VLERRGIGYVNMVGIRHIILDDAVLVNQFVFGSECWEVQLVEGMDVIA